MRRWVLLLVASTGCASATPSMSQGVQFAQQALHGVAIAGKEASAGWSTGVDAQIAYCKRQNLKTEEERRDCMGPWGEGEAFESEFQEFRDAYDEAANGLEKLQKAARKLEARTKKRDE